MNSNYTLRFQRTSREAYGYEIEFKQHDPDRLVWIVSLVGIAFMIGLMVGGVI